MQLERRTFLAGLGLTALGVGAMPADAESSPGVRLTSVEDDIYATIAERPVFRYRARIVEPPAGSSPNLAANGYLHPVTAPNGAVVSNHLSPDHPHQRGIFHAWTKTRIVVDGKEYHPDFWNIHEGTGRVRSVKAQRIERRDSLPVLRAEHVSEARVGDAWVPVLDEVWEIRLLPQPAAKPDSAGAAHVFDLTSRQTPRIAIELPKYLYGGMGVRGTGQWGKGSDLKVLNSEGKDRAGSDQTKARWVDMSGTVDRRQAGLALLEHPANLHAPNGVRMHPEMPYYCFALPQSGPVMLEAGKPYVFRYRIVAHHGAADAAALDALWKEFAGS
jgi:hypothetical protein